MADKILILLGVGFILYCIGDAVVRIIRASKNPSSSKRLNDRIEELESDLADVEQDLEHARKRIEVLEAIVTDGREDLRRRIDDLAG